MTTPNVVKGYVGIDNGTQGLSVIFTDENLAIKATGEASYGFVEDLDKGSFEQRCEDWNAALGLAMASVHKQLAPATIEVLSIGISGQMHGEVLVDDNTNPIKPVRLWCDSRNEAEGHELTKLFQTKIPKRSTAARFLWTIRNQPDVAIKTKNITTPGGWLAFMLTGEFFLGIGDAAGMFPIDSVSQDYDEKRLAQFDALVGDERIPPLLQLLPKVRRAGENGGSLTSAGAKLLGLTTTGIIPVAPAEGDQVAALAGSLIGRAGMVSCCFGTSVCANAVGDRSFHGVSPAVDHFCAADGKQINMVWLRNGTTYLNTIIDSYGGNFDTIMPQLIASPVDCGGLLALPFMDDEPGLQVARGGTAMIVGWNPDNASVGNVCKAALLSTMFNLRLGVGVLDQQGYPRTQLVLTGGLTKTPECGQILADVFSCSVRLLVSADEGSCWGAAVLAKYRQLRSSNTITSDWTAFLDSVATNEENVIFSPDPVNVAIYNLKFEKYRKLVQLQSELSDVLTS